MPDEPPVLTPDGRFRWDGERWVATGPPALPTWALVAIILAGVFGSLFALFVVIFGPTIVALLQAFS